MHVRGHTSSELSSAFALPTIAGIGAGAIAVGNHLVLIGAVIGAVAIVQRAVARVWHWSRDRWKKLDEIRDHSDEVPALRATVEAQGRELAEQGRELVELGRKLDAVLELLSAQRDPNARTRSTDPGGLL